MTFMHIEDRRSFKGIKKCFWTGYDYPTSNLLIGPSDIADSWHDLLDNDYEDLSTAQIDTIAKYHNKHAQIITYQAKNMPTIYGNCLYFSVMCMATFGFGDISPGVWYTKLFASVEVLMGIAIFVFAIEMLLSDWRPGKKEVGS